MKKLVSLLLIIFVCTCLTSCKKEKDSSFGKVDYHFSGVYLEFYDDDTFKVNSKNPSAYYKHELDVFSTNSGNVPNMGYFEFSNMAKHIVNQDGLTVFVLSVNLVIPNNAPDEVKVYIIKEKNGMQYVDVEMVEMIDISKSGKYSVNYQYEYKEVGYRFQFTLGYFRNGDK